MEYEFLMLITYSFDIDYVAVPCETEEDAIREMDRYLETEIGIVKNEHDYTPIVLTMSETEKILVYEDIERGINETNYMPFDHAVYKVVEISHNTKEEKEPDTGQDGLNITKTLTLSIAHICEVTEDMLEETADPCGLYSAQMLPMSVYKKSDYGWWVYLPEYIPSGPAVPDDLRACIELARANGCTWLSLDKYAKRTGLLPEYRQKAVEKVTEA